MTNSSSSSISTGIPEKSWETWKRTPTPYTLSKVVRDVQPAIDLVIRQNPHLNSSIVSGEAKRLAITAIKSFDPSYGASLHTHVVNHLKPLSMRSRNLLRVIPRSRHQQQELSKYRSTLKDFTEEHGREPDATELGDLLKMSPKKIEALSQSPNLEVSESEVEGFPGLDGEIEPDKTGLWADYVYHDLDPEGRLIMDHSTGRHGKETLTVEQIAQKLKMSPTMITRRRQAIAESIIRGLNI